MRKLGMVLWLLIAAVQAEACLEWEGGMGSGWPVCSAMERDLLLLGEGRAMFTADLSDPTHPVKLGSVYFPDYVTSIAIQGTFAYAAVNAEGLWVVDVTDRRTPQVVRHLPTPSKAREVRVDGPLMVLALEYGALQLYDLSEPAVPIPVGGSTERVFEFDLAWPYLLGSVWLEGTPSQSVLVIWDYSDPQNPVERSRTVLGEVVNSMGAEWPHLFMNAQPCSGGGTYLEVWDIGDPALPVRMGTVPEVHEGILAVQNSYLFTVFDEYPGWPSLHSWDVSVPLDPHEAGIWGGFGRWTYGFIIAFPYAVVADNYPNQFRVLRVDPALEPLDVAIPSSGYYLDAEAGKDSIYVLHYREAVFSLEVLDFRAPANIKKTGVVPLGFYESSVFVLDPSTVYAYSYSGLEAVDVSDPRHPVLAGGAGIPNLSVPLVGMTASGTNAFIACTQFVAVMDIADPLYPRYLGTFDTPGGGLYYYDIRGVAAVGSLLIIGNDVRLDVLDVSDPLHPRLLSSAFTTSWIADLKVKGSLAFALETGSGLHIYDFSTPDRIVQVGWLDFPGHSQTELLVSGDRAVLSGSTAAKNELTLVDVSDAQVPRLREIQPISSSAMQMDIMKGYVMSSEMTLDFFNLSDCYHARPSAKP